jgi:sodium-dependent phosphate transporter
MPVLTEYTYIFALGIVFAFADAFNIGANDVANSFSTSVSSRSLTLRQAALIATFCEVVSPVARALKKSFWGLCCWGRGLRRR